jgi:hypothetical protein
LFQSIVNRQRETFRSKELWTTRATDESPLRQLLAHALARYTSARRKRTGGWGNLVYDWSIRSLSLSLAHAFPIRCRRPRPNDGSPSVLCRRHHSRSISSATSLAAQMVGPARRNASCQEQPTPNQDTSCRPIRTMVSSFVCYKDDSPLAVFTDDPTDD